MLSDGCLDVFFFWSSLICGGFLFLNRMNDTQLLSNDPYSLSFALQNQLGVDWWPLSLEILKSLWDKDTVRPMIHNRIEFVVVC